MKTQSLKYKLENLKKADKPVNTSVLNVIYIFFKTPSDLEF